MTLTIEIPDETAARFRVAAEARGQHMGTFAVATMIETADADVSSYSETEALAAVQGGHADFSAGRYVSLEDFRARIEAADAATMRGAIEINGNLLPKATH